MWLYERRDSAYVRTRRVGSRQYGCVATWISGDEFTSPALLASLWRFQLSIGPLGGIDAGFADAGVHGRIWHVRKGVGIGLGYLPGAVRA